ncbi:MAG: rhomboid family intramembrane serine protease, partial [Marmoricola sp.]
DGGRRPAGRAGDHRDGGDRARVTAPPAGGPGGAGSIPDAAPTCYRHTDRETWIRCQRCERPICPDCMNSAAVGFQCPNCVREGNRGSRQGRTPYGGQRVGDPRLTTFVLIGINVAVWLLVQVTGGRSSTLIDLLAMRPDGLCIEPGGNRFLPGASESACNATGFDWLPGVADGAWWQVVTSVFTHEQALHLGFNMLALYFLGPMLENVLGRTRFLALYLVSGIAGSAAVMLLSAPHTLTLGASGAVFGLMGALAVVALKVRGQVQTILMWIGLNLVFTFTVGGISWQGHIGGLVGGALIGAAMVHAPREHRAVVQWSVTALILVGALALIVARALTLNS